MPHAGEASRILADVSHQLTHFEQSGGTADQAGLVLQHVRDTRLALAGWTAGRYGQVGLVDLAGYTVLGASLAHCEKLLVQFQQATSNDSLEWLRDFRIGCVLPLQIAVI